MVFFRVISCFTGTCSLLSFSHPSWSGAWFGNPGETFVPVKAKKAKPAEETETFEFDDKFKII